DSGYNCIHRVDCERDRHLPKNGVHLLGADFFEDLVGRPHSQSENAPHLPFPRAREECGSGYSASDKASMGAQMHRYYIRTLRATRAPIAVILMSAAQT